MVRGKRYLIDSDILITMLRDRTDKTGLRKKALHVGLDNCYVSAVSVAELSSGAHKMKSERGLFEVQFIQTIFNILPFGKEGCKDAELFGEIKASLATGGTPVADMDLLIAASALAGDFTVVTHNMRHFSRITNLAAEDWLCEV